MFDYIYTLPFSCLRYENPDTPSLVVNIKRAQGSGMCEGVELGFSLKLWHYF